MEQTLSRSVKDGDAIQVTDANGDKLVDVGFGISKNGKPMLHIWSVLGGNIIHVKAAEIDAAKPAV